MAEGTWWWDLTAKRAVQRDERPRDAEVLGPYPSREAAEDWEATSKARNETWDAEDERWEDEGRSSG